jgi:hypothetical protein
LQVPGSKFQVPGSKFQVPGSRFQVPGSRFQVPGPRFQVPGSRFQVPGSRFQVPGSRFQVPGSRFRVSDFSIKVCYHSFSPSILLSPLHPFPHSLIPSFCLSLPLSPTLCSLFTLHVFRLTTHDSRTSPVYPNNRCWRIIFFRFKRPVHSIIPYKIWYSHQWRSIRPFSFYCHYPA